MLCNHESVGDLPTHPSRTNGMPSDNFGKFPRGRWSDAKTSTDTDTQTPSDDYSLKSRLVHVGTCDVADPAGNTAVAAALTCAAAESMPAGCLACEV